MKRIRPKSHIYDGFNGYIGIVKFTNGISDEHLPQHLIDRISAAVPMIEVDDDGNEIHAGVAQRIIDLSSERATLTQTFVRETEGDKRAELREMGLKQQKAPVAKFYTPDELTAIADKGGINAVRQVSDLWGIKSRKIADLIQGILDCQKRFIDERDGRLQKIADQDTAASAEQEQTGAEESQEEAPEPEQIDPTQSIQCLLGSSVLAATYDIGGKTVQLGDIVRGAFATFGGTADAWNALAEEAREDLLRLELDRLLAAE